MSNDNISREQKEVKEQLRDKEADFYISKMARGNLKNIDRFAKYHPDPSIQMLNGATFAHRDLESIANAMSNGDDWAVVSGINPSGPLHFGHKLIFDQLLWYQEQGAEVFIPITNDESYVVGKTKTLAESRRIAYEDVIPSIIAMGFDADRTHIFVDSDYPDIYNVAMHVSRMMTFNKACGVFGFDREDEITNPGTVFYRSAVQIGQILLPQYEEFGGPRPVLVPVGVDQIPYLITARDIAEKMDMEPPAHIYTKFQFGLDGKGKMSASRPDSVIYLNEDLKVAEKKLKKAYTGGLPSADTQREIGGVPEICPVGQLLSYNFRKDSSVFDSCNAGELLCGGCKQQMIPQVLGFLEEHQSKLEDARSSIDDYILKIPVTSMLR